MLNIGANHLFGPSLFYHLFFDFFFTSHTWLNLSNMW